MTSEMPVKGEYSLTVPVELVKKTCGLSIDIGGTLAKFLYRSKDNLKEADNKTDSETGHLQLVSFPRNRLSDALAHIKQHAQITRNEPNDRPEIFATGYGCMEFGKTISKTLHIKLKNITEFECLAKAFTHLASEFPRHELLEPHDDAETKKQEERIKKKLAMFAQFLGQTKQDLGPTSTDATPPVEDDHPQSSDEGLSLDKCEHVYPCILAMIGSGTVFLQVNENKSYKILELSQRGGTSFHGMGALLTGVMNFDELLELASRGDEKNVSLYSDDLLPNDGTGDEADTIYAKCAGLKEAELIYSFGKATRTKRENFKPEDLAASWLTYFVMDISQTLILWCQITGIRRLFLCGGFCSNAFVRRRLTKELISKTVVLDLKNPQKNGRIKFDFLKPEINLGTIGALIVQLETSKQETSKAKIS